ncbi:hypothetical protein BGZ60DRAFT_65910 [Tricladium varicosporioides]|nr:hypothetical protein BGZ60DRAFT_65910 [Hymenoscyphus varicosporioides]
MFQQMGKELGNYEHVWERGIDTIRGLTTNQAPKSIEGVISLLLVTSAMRMTVAGEDAFGDRNVFLADLGRWRSIIDLEAHQSLFDEIVLALWEKVMTDELFPNYEDFQGEIAYLGTFLRSLARQTLDLSLLRTDSNSIKQPPGNTNSFILEQPAVTGTQLSTPTNIPPKVPKFAPLHEVANCHFSSLVIMLMCGAIFARIIQCLLSLREQSKVPLCNTRNVTQIAPIVTALVDEFYLEPLERLPLINELDTIRMSVLDLVSFGLVEIF